jgi:DNA-binding transcriptional LysR family regulator
MDASVTTERLAASELGGLSVGVRELAAFVRVVDEGGFSRAARAMHISQPGVSSRIRKLERELGAVLFDRSTRRPALTQAGRRLLPYARELLATFSQARARLATPSHGGPAAGRSLAGKPGSPRRVAPERVGELTLTNPPEVSV